MIMVSVIVFTCFILWSGSTAQSHILETSIPSRRNVQISHRRPVNNRAATAHSFVVLHNTGGWGIGPQRELTPEEFATGGAQNKKYFEGYQIRNRGEFMRQVALDKDAMVRSELDELLGVAAAAGLKVKNPKERLNKFDPSIINDDEDLDVSVQWDAEGDTTSIDTDRSDSITRLDEDTGARGVW